MTEAREPIHKIRSGSVEASVFENSSGGSVCWHSVRIARWYQTKRGAGCEANTYTRAEPRQVTRVARLAEGWLTRYVIHGVDLDGGVE
jgi:hypothetical protein